MAFVAGTAMSAPEGAVSLRDGRTRRPSRAIHDVDRVDVRVANERINVKVTFRVALRDSVFTRVVFKIDTDKKANTGIDGFDLNIITSVGSRYRKSAAPAVGVKGRAPLELRSASYQSLSRRADRTSKVFRTSWVSRSDPRITTPEVKGKEYSFSFPLSMLAENGLNYNDTIRFSVRVEGTICEEPVSIDYVCGDKGAPLAVDGRLVDWPTTAPRIKDATGDLHKAAREVDLKSLLVGHDQKHIHAAVTLARSGFGAGLYDGDDIQDMDRIVLGIEPIGDHGYMKYKEISVYTWESGTSRGWVSGRPSFRHRVRGRVTEFAIPRNAEQARFRVIVWTDAHRIDTVPDRGLASLKIPKAAWHVEEDEGEESTFEDSGNK